MKKRIEKRNVTNVFRICLMHRDVVRNMRECKKKAQKLSATYNETQTGDHTMRNLIILKLHCIYCNLLFTSFSTTLFVAIL
ncbi:CLUMA_CG012233, isoform A [Clunio marinus]|uniref:CLUMA_CG012233, isoform A n=1 Tax=Clunio marinus TaxID=568069 RepID=A0A1J1IFV4_9DIPT|nr:CLUMA_CG012233, isoform A [Clunio marinus]